EKRRGFGNPPSGVRREAFERGNEALVDHAGADIGPAGGLVLLGEDLVAVVDLAADRFLERVEVEAGLGLQGLRWEAADLEEFVDRLVDLFLGAAFAERVDDQG